ncbi:MAG: LytTR family transcriptional regulator DNA-binding domain-containing protein [Candidatus Marinimicrobia bacterium]|nr:LytTR family transcriptional regulator DNA-binding domain-containing protein [Candidatus Neomarinimicrobiota bacterium]
MVQTFLQNLKSPFPYHDGSKSHLYIPPIILLILMLFHPFGLNNIEPAGKKYIVELGYGIVTFIVLLFFLKLLPLLVPKFFYEKKWSVWKEILLTLQIIFGIGIANGIYTHLWGYTLLNLTSLLAFVFYTLIVAIFPVSFSILIRKNKYLQENLSNAAIFNERIETQSAKDMQYDTYHFTGASENDTIILDPKDVLYIQSQRNYVQFVYTLKTEIRQRLIRAKLGDVEESLRNVPFLHRCHRSFIVNIRQVEKFKGDSLGLILYLKNCRDEIPVSRSCVKDLKKIIQ